MNNRNILVTILFLLFSGMAFGQHMLTYQSYVKDVERQDTTLVRVLENNGQLKIESLGNKVNNPIPGYAESITCVDYMQDSVFTLLQYPDGRYYSAYPFSDNDVVFTEEGKEKVLGYPCVKYKTSINSNTIEVWMTEKPGFEATPMPQLGRLQGVMVRCTRNGNYVTDLNTIKKDKTAKALIPIDKGDRKTSRELSQLRKDKLVMRIPIFADEQIHFADYELSQGEILFDSTIHFSHGTVIVKRMQLPQLPEHYQLFAEIH